ncbi:hypothetical protein H112_03865 [Trichophyton rubrum D6]|uniref:Uncharacterized protein n=2 Tax=Trichophyton TaxID=5550 RepID=A0A022W4Y6_TRIRU|nr:hypothetical protein H100_03873 [Trichophyton rubrum MR850]EZF42575.1 hypothetical protein H102_03860 [Trichophyton rubrum CBS 100081]EZF53191.1 hypothetical protein H103_03874 [Trichophyton rubrum CBS 288.86]EZF63859.1 hypothetical protein H104_03859 [Trichophyton rubrum CBS 289.86]EZF74179.1 hypothetical protein H105_03887 [Trichophyton soudanense CBS 452.61]EZF85139.1 hypothetical protein H110_03866 [Trichophyton rubrum MR1448]EZG17288.1 hypothetical protein H107_03985 [Trichophyton rub
MLILIFLRVDITIFLGNFPGELATSSVCPSTRYMLPLLRHIKGLKPCGEWGSCITRELDDYSERTATGSLGNLVSSGAVYQPAPRPYFGEQVISRGREQNYHGDDDL